ncbi:hypothetical protein CspHIS471_0502920 [Cutaneotrichosporon sp. HIS471]|nr:hypothetical protein CspHIS471_0502920 [Cutaneotrichosporon sp. HIS471]
MTSSSPLKLTIPRTIALTGLAYAVYETRRLVSRYPLHYSSSAPPSSQTLWPSGLTRPIEVTALTRVPHGADPRETFIAAFYDTWTLRLEGFLFRNANIGWAIDPPPVIAPVPQPQDPEFASRPLATPYTPPPTPAGAATPTEPLPTGYASGLFPVIGRSADSTMVFWGSINDMGGAQLLTCTRVPNSKTDEVKISYGSAETPFIKEGSILGWIGTKFHRMYMRYLVDRAAARMDKWAAAADARR